MSWKAIAIVFIILFLVETSLIGFVWVAGGKYLEEETECANDFCGGYDAYLYQDGVCKCYTGNELVKEGAIK